MTEYHSTFYQPTIMAHTACCLLPPVRADNNTSFTLTGLLLPHHLWSANAFAELQYR